MQQGSYHSYKELDKKFNLGKFKITSKKIYLEAGVDFLSYPLKRPAGCQEILKKELIGYLRNEISNNHYPSRREIENKFRVKIGELFGDIEGLYAKVGSKYVKKNNQRIKEEKAKLLTNAVLKILSSKLGLTLLVLRDVNQQGIDIIAEDHEGKRVGIEIKAFNKFESIKKKNLDQIKVFISKENLNKIIIITTASRISKNINLPKNVNVFLYRDLCRLFSKDIIEQLDYVRNYSIHIETLDKENKRKEIIQFVKSETAKHHKISVNSIDNHFKIDFYTYFKNFYEVIEKAGIEPDFTMIRGITDEDKRNIEKEFLIGKILKFIESETKKGYYPTGEDIGENFGIKHIWNYIRMSDLYKRLNLPPYLEREHRIRRLKQCNRFPRI